MSVTNGVVYGAAGVGQQVTGVGSWDSKLAVAQHFRDIGLRLTVLRPMAFMELMTDKGYYPSVGVWHMMPKLMAPPGRWGGCAPTTWAPLRLACSPTQEPGVMPT